MTNHVVSLDEIKNIYNRLFAINKLLKGLKESESLKENFALTASKYVDNLKDLVKKAKVSEDNYLQELAKLTQVQIKGALIRNKKYNDSTISSIKEVLNPQLIKQLVELESGVISYG